MKRWLCILTTLVVVQITSGQVGSSRNFLPPFHFNVDSVTLLATWEAPKTVLLVENFEGEDFPPTGWSDTTLGIGWLCEDNPQYHWWWIVPEHSGKQAQVNDDIAPYTNNGSMDYLVTPSLDLTVADSFYLVFDSYFNHGWGEQAFVEYSLDGGTTWQLLHEVNASLEWQKVRVDLSGFSGTGGASNLLIAFHADDNGYYASGWAVDNVAIYSDYNPGQVLSYKLFLETEYAGPSECCDFQYYFDYSSTHSCGILAHYQNGNSDTVWQTVHSSYLIKPTDLTGSAPDQAVILHWSPPWLPGPGKGEKRDVGDIIDSFQSPSPIGLCFGICDDGYFLWVSDPNESATTIYQLDHEGNSTGETITINLGQSWVGDMVSDGQYLYGCLVGGPNSIVKVDLASGETVGTISGEFSLTSQFGLAADFTNEEFYIGGWNSDQIWRTTFDGTIISTISLDGVSGLAWHETGGPDAEGSLWVVTNTPNSLIYEMDPNNGWLFYQAFIIPGGEPFCGAGAEVKRGGPNCGCLWICNQTENTIYLVDVNEPLATPCSSEFGIPDNLVGFNIYKDGLKIDSIPCTEEECCYYIDPIDLNSEGGVFNYEVTAVYDLSVYGYPGETGESLPEGPFPIYTWFYWLELNFLEDWSSGTFDDNNWYTSDSSWQISQDLGNEEPSAVFMPENELTDYNSVLQSYQFFNYPAQIEVVMEYDVKLSSSNPTGNEKLETQVFDYASKTWNTVRTMTNLQGSFNWVAVSQNISGAFNNELFKIRFVASGANSSDIDYWAVDNIALTMVCPSPTSLYLILLDPPQDSILVDWSEPMPPLAEWLHWDDGIHDGSIGWGDGKESWKGIATHWTPAILKNIKGAELTKIGFIPSDYRAFFKVAVWVGDNTTPVYVQATGDLVLNEYNIVQLEKPLKIDITKDLYVGYLVSAYTGYPASCDNGPAIDGYGNMVLDGNPLEWKTLKDINPDLDFNWNIQGYFERDEVPYDGFYDVYRRIDDNEPEVIAETTEHQYYDNIEGAIGTYCYQVTCVLEGGCLSPGYGTEDCILLTETADIEAEKEGFVNIYPNPASDVLFIESAEWMESVGIYDSRGETVKQWNNGTVEQWNSGRVVGWNGGKVEIPVSGLAPGLYLVRVETGGKVIGKKVVVR